MIAAAQVPDAKISVFDHGLLYGDGVFAKRVNPDRRIEKKRAQDQQLLFDFTEFAEAAAAKAKITSRTSLALARSISLVMRKSSGRTPSSAEDSSASRATGSG